MTRTRVPGLRGIIAGAALVLSILPGCGRDTLKPIDPCALLTTDQIEGVFAFAVATPQRGDDEPQTCQWRRADDSGVDVNASIDVTKQKGSARERAALANTPEGNQFVRMPYGIGRAGIDPIGDVYLYVDTKRGLLEMRYTVLNGQTTSKDLARVIALARKVSVPK